MKLNLDTVFYLDTYISIWLSSLGRYRGLRIPDPALESL